MKENKATERTRMEEQLCAFFFFLVYFLSVDTSPSFFSFFLNWPYFQQVYFRRKNLIDFSKELIPSEPLAQIL